MLETTRPLRCSPLCLGDRGPGTGTVSVTSHIQTHCPPTRPLPFLAGSHGTHFSWYPPQGLRVPCRINRIVSLPTENPSEAPQGPQARSKLLSDMRPVPAAAQREIRQGLLQTLPRLALHGSVCTALLSLSACLFPFRIPLRVPCLQEALLEFPKH